MSAVGLAASYKRYNLKMNLLKLLKDNVWLYGMCPGCLTIHGDAEQIEYYLNWLVSLGVISKN